MPQSDEMMGRSCICQEIFDPVWREWLFGVMKEFYLVPEILGLCRGRAIVCAMCSIQGSDDHSSLSVAEPGLKLSIAIA